MKNAQSVPELDTSASRPTGKKPEKIVTPTPVMIVTTCGVWYFGCNLLRKLGSRPSRAMAKNNRVWPKSIIRMTDGRARNAASPIRPATLL